jgi:3-isopropylmalate/(R)-2-methylmalate dehydratase small subunit
MKNDAFYFFGRVLRIGENIDTDAIIPSTYLSLRDPEKMAKHCLENDLPDFREAIKDHHILVAGKNFGCGSSREQAPLALRYSAVKCVIATSFSRIFFRNAINVGLPVIELEKSNELAQEDSVEVDFNDGVIYNVTTDKRYVAEPVSFFMREIIASGGLMHYLEKRLLDE